MLLSEPELNLLSSLKLFPRTKVRGQPSSNFRSLDKGAGLEFADYRNYVPGDDIRRLDPNQYQKHRKLVVRQYDHYESISFILIADLSDSMDCGRQLKIQSVRKLCAAFSFMILKHGYKVTILPAGGDMPARRFSGLPQWHNCQTHIEVLPIGGKKEITDALNKFGGRAKTAESLIIISDFICSKGLAVLEAALSQLQQNILYIHLFSESEINPAAGDLTLIDSELRTELPMAMDSRNIEAYKNTYRQYYDNLKQFAVRSGHIYIDICGESGLTEQVNSLTRDGVVYL